MFSKPSRRWRVTLKAEKVSAVPSELVATGANQVVIRDVASPRTLWIGGDEERVFVVLDPDVQNASHVPLRAGERVTLIGLVRAAPSEGDAIKQWALDAATAKTVRERGTYLHVTEIKPAD